MTTMVRLKYWGALAWRHSLWLTLPLAILLSLWWVLAWLRFSSIEPAVLPQDNASFGQVLDYEARHLLAQWQNKFIHRSAPFGQLITPVQLMVPTRELKALSHDLPQSGKNYVKGKLLLADGYHKIKLRLRGNHPRHWRTEKKSLRVKMQGDKLWRDLNRFELLAPADKSLLGAYLSAQLAKLMGLPGADIELAWVYINGQSNGLYLLSESIDEQTLINHNLMPGDIYAGEVAKRDAYSGVDNRLFHHSGLWQKLAHNSDHPRTQRTSLNLLVSWLQQPQIDYQQLRQLVDYPMFARFYLFHQLIGSTNIDQFHNWRLYFDHSRGRFFPLVWDPEGWPQHGLESDPGALIDALRQDPVFIQAVRRQYWQLDMPGRLASFVEKAEQIRRELTTWVGNDPVRSIDLQYYDEQDYLEASAALIQRMKQAFAITIAKPDEVPKAPEPLKWQGQRQFNGVTHIRQPVEVAAGSRILLGSGAVLVFHHRVNLNGTAQQPIEFAALGEQPYGAVVLQGADANGSSLNHCRFSGGSAYKNGVINFTAMLSLHEVSDVAIDHCHFSKNAESDDMVHGVYAEVTITNSTFEHAVGDGLDLELSHAFIANSEFRENASEGVDLMHSDVVLRDVTLIDNLDNAISAGQKSKVRLENGFIQGAKSALLVKDSSFMRVTHSELTQNGLIAKVSHRNDHYAEGGQLYIYRSKMYDNQRFFDVEKSARLAIYDSYLWPRFSSDKKRITIDETTNDYQPTVASAQFKRYKKEVEAFAQLDQLIAPQAMADKRGIVNEQP